MNPQAPVPSVADAKLVIGITLAVSKLPDAIRDAKACPSGRFWECPEIARPAAKGRGIAFEIAELMRALAKRLQMDSGWGIHPKEPSNHYEYLSVRL